MERGFRRLSGYLRIQSGLRQLIKTDLLVKTASYFLIFLLNIKRQPT